MPSTCAWLRALFQGKDRVVSKAAGPSRPSRAALDLRRGRAGEERGEARSTPGRGGGACRSAEARGRARSRRGRRVPGRHPRTGPRKAGTKSLRESRLRGPTVRPPGGATGPGFPPTRGQGRGPPRGGAARGTEPAGPWRPRAAAPRASCSGSCSSSPRSLGRRAGPHRPHPPRRPPPRRPRGAAARAPARACGGLRDRPRPPGPKRRPHPPK